MEPPGRPECLRTDHARRPLGIDATAPRFSWAYDAESPGRQTGYRVLVASSEDRLAADHGDLWNSGWVDDDCQAAEFEGDRIDPRTRYWWKVRGRNETTYSAWSEPSWFETGIDEWNAAWIGADATGEVSPDDADEARSDDADDTDVAVEAPAPAPRFRRRFSLDRPVERARLYVAVGGLYEATLNGKRVGDHVLDTAPTDYEERAPYATHDVTDDLRAGENILEVVLGRGRYALTTENVWGWHRAPWHGDRPELLAELGITFADGSERTIGTDEEWIVRGSPTRFDSIYEGEVYDARFADAAVDATGADLADATGTDVAVDTTGDWERANRVDGPAGSIVAQELQPMRVVDERAPVEIDEVKPGVHVFDFGEVTAGWAELRVDGPEGTTVTTTYGEKRRADGTVDVEQVHVDAEIQTDTYVLCGDGVETWEPRFSYKGFQYVEVRGLPGTPSADTLTAKVVHTTVDEGPTGSFECGDELLNRIHENVRRTLLNNFHGIPTDTPVYEKNGWTGDALLAAPTACYNFQMTRFFGKWLDDVADAQRADGEIPPIVPTSDWGYSDAPFGGAITSPNPGWDAAYLVVPWVTYRHSGDERILREHYDGMCATVEYLREYADSGIVDEGLGDYLAPGRGEIRPPPPEGTAITGTAYYYRSIDVLATVADVLERTADANRFAALREDVAARFNEAFLDADSGVYATGTVDEYRQTSNVLPLAFGLVPDEHEQLVVENLVDDVVETRDGHLDTGFHGTAYLLPTLTEAGHVDVAYGIATRTTYPSWGRWIQAHDATSIYEAWELDSRSRDHCPFGAIGEWFYAYLAGIRPAQPGFERVRIDPYPPTDMDRAAATVETVRGPVSVAWTREEGDPFALDVSVPGNTTATVVVPGDGEVRLDGNPLESAEAVEDVRWVGSRLRCDVGPGAYHFTRSTGQ